MTALPWTDDIPRGGDAARDLALLWPLLGRHITFHRRLVDLTHSVKAAVLLSQTIYWTRHGRDIALTAGWFHKTTTQWQRETGLTAREQVHARAVLIRLGLIDERRRGVPALLHFRLMPARLAALLADGLGDPARGLDSADATALLALLGPPLAYHRVLAEVCGGVHAGLMLSRSLYLVRYPTGLWRDGWFCTPLKFWSDEIGLGRREQETARQALLRHALWEEAIRGIPPRLRVRVRINVLHARLRQLVAGVQHHAPNMPVREFPDGGIHATKPDTIPPSSVRDCRHPDSTKPPNQFRQKRHNSFDKSAPLNVHSSTGCLVQTPLQPPPQSTRLADAVDAASGGELILPPQLLPDERQAAAVLVGRCPHQAQSLLDELAARLERRSIHTSPLAYLRGLVQRAVAGSFVPELAAGVAAARRRQAEIIQLRVQRESDAQRLRDAQDSPEYQDQVAARRAQVRQMLDAMRARQSPRKTS